MSLYQLGADAQTASCCLFLRNKTHFLIKKNKTLLSGSPNVLYRFIDHNLISHLLSCLLSSSGQLVSGVEGGGPEITL